MFVFRDTSNVEVGKKSKDCFVTLIEIRMHLIWGISVYNKKYNQIWI